MLRCAAWDEPQKTGYKLIGNVGHSKKANRMPTTDTPSWETASPSLIGRAVAGDNEAWQRLIQIYGPLIYTWSRRNGLMPQDAADVTQETLSAVALRIGSFDSSRPDATFRGWLWTIARNKTADWIRGAPDRLGACGGSTNVARLNQIMDEDDYSKSYEGSHASGEIAADRKAVLGRAIALIRNHFEPNTWQAFWRTTVDGQSPESVAEELSLSRWAVYKARSRVLHRLRTELEGLENMDGGDE
ncbi:RNA polymerase sigma factor RpoE [Pirellula sp. SH-Sr6A]|uniref:RNA polymerase sigma factor n=1 Tax=Pirellula sp. SH-Sr6A TaxID=1632865 RepID=UPI00078C6B1A|nr:sigma-70 family RNA polymerase sigma factor [Pirellula sp. SH-Sr6A]AMV33429.1 RNA polymerase sigma factor RpoE [Pirellula sp. SH-Sr6A]